MFDPISVIFIKSNIIKHSLQEDQTELAYSRRDHSKTLCNKTKATFSTS